MNLGTKDNPVILDTQEAYDKYMADVAAVEATDRDKLVAELLPVHQAVADAYHPTMKIKVQTKELT